MNKRAEVEGDVPMILVKLIFASLLILLVTWLLVSLWMAMFGNDNKTEKDNFETLYKLIDAKSKSTTEYDSTRVTIYLVQTKGITGILTTDHTIQFFSPNEDPIQCAGGDPLYRPSDCGDKTLPCICLYDSDPDRPQDDKDDDVIECKQFSTSFDIANDDFQLVDYSDDCLRTIDNEYMKLIVGVQNSGGKRRVFVWQDTPENRALDIQLQKNNCPNTAGLCKDKKDSEIITDFKQVNDECAKADPSKFYSEAKCVFNGKECSVKCTGTDCSSIKTCQDFNFNKDYFVEKSSEEYLCKNKICGKTCSGNLIEQYTCLPNKEQECKDLINDVTIPDFISNCAVVIGPFSSLTSGNKNYDNAKMTELGDIIGFDSTKQNTANIQCQSEIEKYFKKYPVLVCKSGVDCIPFVRKSPPPSKDIQDLLDNCKINPMSAGRTVTITRQDVICAELNNYFTSAYNCADAVTPRFV
jgi:hypothetical protein